MEHYPKHSEHKSKQAKQNIEDFVIPPSVKPAEPVDECKYCELDQFEEDAKKSFQPSNLCLHGKKLRVNCWMSNLIPMHFFPEIKLHWAENKGHEPHDVLGYMLCCLCRQINVEYQIRSCYQTSKGSFIYSVCPKLLKIVSWQKVIFNSALACEPTEFTFLISVAVMSMHVVLC